MEHLKTVPGDSFGSLWSLLSFLSDFFKSVFTAQIGKLQYSYSFKYNAAQTPTTDFPKVRHVLRLDTSHFLKLRHASVCLTSAFYMKKHI